MKLWTAHTHTRVGMDDFLMDEFLLQSTDKQRSSSLYGVGLAATGSKDNNNRDDDDDDDVEPMSDDGSDSDFDEDEDPDKIEVPGKIDCASEMRRMGFLPADHVFLLRPPVCACSE